MDQWIDSVGMTFVQQTSPLRRSRPAARAVSVIVLAGLLCPVSPLRAQEEVGAQTGADAARPEWNTPAVLDLIGRARDLRQSTAIDPDLQTYAAEARGYVYFFIDRPDSAEQILVKADQVALDMWWRAPNHTRQTIVGLRDEKVLPTSIRYHMDHLTVIQDDFGDQILLGDGDEVSSVVHPIAPQAAELYDYRVSDSLSITYGSGEQVRVYEVRVRPKDLDQPGFVGSVYLDLDRAAIVRMSFSFTPSSYVDPYLDYIRISLDNSLWMERFWLPYRQEIEIRREIPLFDFLAGSIIRGRFDVRAYDFNAELPDDFRGRTIRSRSVAEREAFPFERGLFDDLEESGGLRTPPSIVEVEAQVREVVNDKVMSGLAPIRLHGGRLSDFARYDRAEGIFVGAGATFRPTGSVAIRATGGYAIGREQASGSVRISDSEARDGWTPTLDGYFDALTDIGGTAGATLLENTITSAAGSRDYLDPYFRRGASLTLRAPRNGSGGQSAWTVGLRFEEHRGAQDVVSGPEGSDFRPVRSIDEGTMGAVEVGAGFALPGDVRVRMTGTGGRLSDKDFASLDLDVRRSFSDSDERWTGEARLTGGLLSSGAPAQRAYLLGGRHTLMGHEYRLFAGRAFWLARGEVTIPVHASWLGVRAFTSIGSTYLGNWALPTDWAARPSNGLRGTVGLGLAIGWDSLHFDVGRAVWGTGWEAMLSVAPQFRGWM